MKWLLLIILSVMNLYAPYDPTPKGGKTKQPQFFIKYCPRTGHWVRIRINSCIIDEEHLNQPERSKREDLLTIISKMRCSDHCGNTVKEAQ